MKSHQKTAKVYDSLRKSKGCYPEVAMIAKGLKIDIKFHHTKLDWVGLPQQNDAINCGLYCLFFLKCLASGQRIPSDFDLESNRKEVLAILDD